jgi:hypothetical protein
VAGVEHVAAHDDRPSILTAARSRPLRVLVCGSRDWGEYDPISRRLGALPPGSVIVHGMASRIVRGRQVSADMIADTVAMAMDFSVDRHPANWKHYGKAAGYIRNLAMLDTRPDLVLAFQRNGSRGTQHTIDEARRRGIPVEVFTA